MRNRFSETYITDVADAMPHVPIQIAPDPAHFVSTLKALSGIAPVVRAGHIVFVPRRLAMDARMAGKFGSNAWETLRRNGKARTAQLATVARFRGRNHPALW